MIEQYLNISNSLRNLSDWEFDCILPQLADELSFVEFELTYTDQELYKSWQTLMNVTHAGKFIPSQYRHGMELCEHYMPNFWDIQNSKGNSFRTLWQNPTNLMKVLRLNRKMHSTPYMSELRRTLYFSFGLPKSTMYRPGLAKNIVSYYRAQRVFDPCAGWGGRMLGAVAAGAHYTAFEPNCATYNNLWKIVKFLGLESKITLINAPAQSISRSEFDEFDMILTSPPYFSLEVYSGEATQSYARDMTYPEWVDNFLEPVILQSMDLLRPGGVSCWNVANVGKYRLIDDVKHIHEKRSFSQDDTFGITASSRPSGVSRKSIDTTVAYTHVGTPTKQTWF